MTNVTPDEDLVPALYKYRSGRSFMHDPSHVAIKEYKFTSAPPPLPRIYAPFDANEVMTSFGNAGGDGEEQLLGRTTRKRARYIVILCHYLILCL
jgi:hypothetical protein